MAERKTETDKSGLQFVLSAWLPVVFRGLVVLILTPAAVLKFVDYSGQAGAFADYGIPAPEITVLLVGAVQIPAAIMIAFGAAGRLGSLIVIPIMITAMVTAGVAPSNTIVLLSCLGIAALGTGKYSLWTPDAALIHRVPVLGSAGSSEESTDSRKHAVANREGTDE